MHLRSFLKLLKEAPVIACESLLFYHKFSFTPRAAWSFCAVLCRTSITNWTRWRRSSRDAPSVNCKRCGNYTRCRLRGDRKHVPYCLHYRRSRLFRASCVDSFKFESFKLLEAKIEAALSTERPSEQSKYAICYAIHVISTEWEGENTHQGVSSDRRRS